MTIAHAQTNLDAFYGRLVVELRRLFREDPEYSYAASQTTPDVLAMKMTLGLDNGSASKDGKAVSATCKHFGIPHSYKAIRQFLSEA